MTLTEEQWQRARNNRAKAVLKLARGQHHEDVIRALKKWERELPAGVELAGLVTDEAAAAGLCKLVRFYLA